LLQNGKTPYDYLIGREIISDLAGLYPSNPTDPGVQMVLNALPKERLPELPKTIEAVAENDRRRRRDNGGIDVPSRGEPIKGRGQARSATLRRYTKTTQI
jgi:hypothetical protein